MARSFIQLSNTAHMAPQSCSMGSFGKSLPVCCLIASLNRVTSCFSSSTFISLSSDMPRCAFTFCIIASNGSMSSLLTGFIPITTSPYICTKRRSYANRSLPVFLARPSTTVSLSPRLRIVSIIPGMEARAPDLTDTSRGLDASPNLQPISDSICFTDFSTSSFSKATTSSLPFSKYSLHTSVVIVNPGGTGTPIRFISARLAPLPPSRFLMSALPSAFPLPKV